MPARRRVSGGVATTPRPPTTLRPLRANTTLRSSLGPPVSFREDEFETVVVQCLHARIGGNDPLAVQRQAGAQRVSIARQDDRMSSPRPKPIHNLLRHEVRISGVAVAGAALADVATAVTGTRGAEATGPASLYRRLLDMAPKKSNHPTMAPVKKRSSLVLTCLLQVLLILAQSLSFVGSQLAVHLALPVLEFRDVARHFLGVTRKGTQHCVLIPVRHLLGCVEIIDH